MKRRRLTVDRDAVAAFNEERRHVKVIRWDRKKHCHYVLKVIYKHLAQ